VETPFVPMLLIQFLQVSSIVNVGVIPALTSTQTVSDDAPNSNFDLVTVREFFCFWVIETSTFFAPQASTTVAVRSSVSLFRLTDTFTVALSPALPEEGDTEHHSEARLSESAAVQLPEEEKATVTEDASSGNTIEDWDGSRSSIFSFPDGVSPPPEFSPLPQEKSASTAASVNKPFLKACPTLLNEKENISVFCCCPATNPNPDGYKKKTWEFYSLLIPTSGLGCLH